MNGFELEKKSFCEALSFLDRIPARAGLLSSQYLLVRCKGHTLEFSLSSEVAGVIRIGGKGVWPFAEKPYWIDRRLLVPFVSAGKQIRTEAPFTFSKVDSSLCLQHGRRTATYGPLEEVGGYAKDPEFGKVTVLRVTREFLAALQCARACATEASSLPQLNCVYVLSTPGGEVKLRATNEILIYSGVHKHGKAPRELSCPFPLFLSELVTEGMVLKVTDQFVLIQGQYGNLWQPVSSQAKKKFPGKLLSAHVKRGYSAQAQELFSIPCGRLQTVLDRLSVYLTHVRRREWILKISGESKRPLLLLECEIPQTVFREKISLPNPLKRDVTLTWPLEMIMPVLSYWALSKRDSALRVKTLRGVQASPQYLSTSGAMLVVAGVQPEK